MSHAIMMNPFHLWGGSELRLYGVSMYRWATDFYQSNFLSIPREVFHDVQKILHKRKDSPLEPLPRDCVMYILSFLEPHDILKVQTLNKAWYDICSSDFLWKKIFFSRFRFSKLPAPTHDYKWLYFRKLYAERYDRILKYRQERNTAIQYALLKSWGGGLLAVVPVYLILRGTHSWHHIPNNRTRVAFGLILTSASFQDFFDKLSKLQQTVNPKVMRWKNISRIVLAGVTLEYFCDFVLHIGKAVKNSMIQQV